MVREDGDGTDLERQTGQDWSPEDWVTGGLVSGVGRQ